MYLTRSFLVLVVILGSLDIWSAEGTKHPRTTRPAKATSTTRKADELDLEKDAKHYYRPKPPQFSTLKPPHFPSQLPTVRPSLPPPPPPLYPVPSTSPPYYPTVGPSHPPPQHNHPTGTPAYYPPHQVTVGPSYHPSQPPHRPTFRPTLTPYPTGYPSHGLSTSTARPIPQQTIVDQFDNRYPDGSYEFRYELPDETVRYERGYFVVYQHKRILVVKGYYSYRLPDRRYHTVFYTADQFGYRHDSAVFSVQRPVLPHSLKVDLTSDGDLRTADDLPTSTPNATTLATE